MRTRLGLLVALALLPAAPAAAQPVDTYPVESFTYWADNPRRDAQDRELGQYNFEAGLYGAARREVQRAPGPDADASHELQLAYDALLHNRPDLPHSHWGDVGHPDYMPDWDNDGVFGDSGGTSFDGRGDFDADTDDVLDTAPFRIPCYTDADGWLVHHRATDGSCDLTDAGPHATGIAREVRIINSRGLVLDATLWLPPGASEATRNPGIVFSNGLSSRQDHYSWFAQRMAGAGFVVLTHDPSGQGGSEGTWSDLYGYGQAPRADCEFAGACLDTQDVTRWFAGHAIPPVADTGFRFEPRKDPATNAPNPVLGMLDTSRIALAGNSMGALGTLVYLRELAAGADLPPVVAAVSLSGATATNAIVPTQFQTSDYDGSPALVGPTALGVNLGADGDGIGYKLIKQRYDLLRTTTDPSPLSLVVLEGGVHTDHVAVPFITRTLWANSLAGDYAQDWLDCHVQADASACAGAVTARPHLSRAFASEQDPDGPDGPEPSRCITVPDKASLNQEPEHFVAAAAGTPVFDCTP